MIRGGLHVILDVDAIRNPLTGIGRYACGLVKGLTDHPQIESLLFIDNGRWIVDPLAGLNSPPEGGRGRSRPPVAALVQTLVSLPPLMAGYRRLRSLLTWQRLKRFGDYLYHTPNYFLPPFPGRAIATIHDLSVLRYPEFHPIERVALFEHEWAKTLARAHHLITPSESIRQELIQDHGWPAERVTAIPLGVDPSFHPRLPAELVPSLAAYGLQPADYCLCVATIEPRKNIPGLIEAHARLPDPVKRHFPLVLVGARGWRSEAIHQRIAAAQASGQARYLHYVDEGHLPSLIAGARLFIFPSFYEGFGLPVLEAMASGVPVITSNCPALVELAQGVALHIDPSDLDGLTQAIQRGLEDEVWRARAQVGGIERARCFTWAGSIDQTVRLYTSVLAQDR